MRTNGDMHMKRALRLAGAGLAALTLALVALVADSGGAFGQAVVPPGQCPAGYEKALESAPQNGIFSIVYKGVTISSTDGFTVNFSSPTANVSGLSVGGGSDRNTVAYDPPVSSGAVASPNNPGGNQATISNVCIRFGTASTTTTTAGATTTTAAGATTTTVAVSPTTVVGTTEEVLGVVVTPGAPRTGEPAAEAAPETQVLPAELARTGTSPLALALAGAGMLLIGGAMGFYAHGARLARRIEVRS